MNAKKNIIFITAALYLFCNLFFTEYTVYVLYPISLFTTYLHELGHAVMALITGGRVASLDINSDTSGVTLASSSSVFLLASGGYIGSIIFGNLLLLLSYRFDKSSKWIVNILSGIMFLTSFIWFADATSTGIVCGLALFLLVTSRFGSSQSVLLVLSVCVILSVIRNYEVGPSGDQAIIESITKIPVVIWRFIWLGIAILISYKTLKRIIIS